MFQVVKQDEAGLQFSPQHGIDRVDRYIDGLVGFRGRESRHVRGFLASW